MPAQAAGATLAALRGNVKDQTGTPVPEATVMVKSLGTELGRAASSSANTHTNTITNEEGQFEILQLPPGTYAIHVSRPGFQSQTQQGLELRAGQAASLDFLLAANSGSANASFQDSPKQDPPPQGAASDEAQSSSATSETNTTGETSETNATSLIDESQLAGLPLNGRSYSQLATLQDGVSDPSSGSASRGGGSGSLTVAGGRSTSNVFLLDGTNIMNLDNQVPRSAAGVQLGSDAVFQVRVFSAHYRAEYGRGSGGILNSITQSGTPEFHGSFFEFFRNSKLDARNFFDPGPEPTPFKRNQFGFTVTGPVVKDRTFLMGSFEGLRDRLTETNIDFFPDELARQGMITNAAGEVIQTVEVHPEAKPYLELYPLPNSRPVGRGIGENAAPQFLPTNENFFTLRVDHRISERDSFFARYTFDDATGFDDAGRAGKWERRW